MMRVRDDFRSLSGPEKAALLILSLGEDQASLLLERMDDSEIRELSQVMAGLGTVSATVVERLIIEFADAFARRGNVMGTIESTERLLSKVLDKDRVASLMEDIRGPAGRTMWDKLGNVAETTLANFLRNEYPQTVAVILSKIREDHAGRVLAVLPETFAMEVIMRMLRMEAVQKDVLNDIERTLRTEFMNNLTRTNRRDPHQMMAEIFNGFDRTTEQRFMASLEERNKESAEKIRALMFTFDDLQHLDSASVQGLMRSAEKEKLTLAIKGASDELRNLFLGNMSERAAKLLREDMAAMGPVRLRDVDEAQLYMVQLAKDLAERGEITIPDKKGGGDELVY